MKEKSDPEVKAGLGTAMGLDDPQPFSFQSTV